MKISLEIGRSYARAKDRPATAPPATGEIGRTGTKTWAGRLFEDYKPELAGRQAVEIYDRMRRSDTQVAMTLRAMKLPILQAQWQVVPSEDDPEMGEEIALGVSRMLFGSGRVGKRYWRSVLRHALLMLDFGFSCLEEVWELRDRPENMKDLKAPEKMYWLAGLEPRLPQTIDRWLGLEEPPYKLTGVQQIILTGGKNPPPIPAENLLVFTNEREGDDYQGRSILRSAYKSWYYADMLEKFDAIGLERAAIGLPEIHYDSLEGIDPKEARERAEQILMHLNASEQGYIVTMPGQKFDPHTTTYNNDAIRASIRAHKRDISVNAIMQFMELGAESSSGSRATAQEQKGPFDLAELALADEVAETITCETITDVVRYNWGERPGYPSLVPSGVLDTNMREMATIILSLVKAGALIPDTRLEDWAREMANLPRAVRPAGEDDYQLPIPGQQAPPPDAGAEYSVRHMGAEAKPFWREPTPRERFVAFAQIKFDLDQAKEGFVSRVGQVAAEMAAEMAEDASRLVSAGDFDRLIALRASLVPKLASKIKGELRPLVAYGRQSVREEHERARKGTPADAIIRERKDGIRGYADDLLSDEGLATWQAVKASRRAQAIAAAIEAVIIDEGLRLIRTGVEAVETLAETATKAADRGVLYAAGLLISEAFGMGRGAEIQREVEQGQIVKGIYSALLDDAVCENCRPLDGREFTPGEPEFDKYMDGNADECLGGERCRCMLFLEYADMQEPVVKDWEPGDDPSVVMP